MQDRFMASTTGLKKRLRTRRRSHERRGAFWSVNRSEPPRKSSRAAEPVRAPDRGGMK
jgi:hypothetical protein